MPKPNGGVQLRQPLFVDATRRQAERYDGGKRFPHDVDVFNVEKLDVAGLIVRIGAGLVPFSHQLIGLGVNPGPQIRDPEPVGIGGGWRLFRSVPHLLWRPGVRVALRFLRSGTFEVLTAADDGL